VGVCQTANGKRPLVEVKMLVALSSKAWEMGDGHCLPSNFSIFHVAFHE